MAWTHLTYREAGTADQKSNLVDLTKELEKAQLVRAKHVKQCLTPLPLIAVHPGCCQRSTDDAGMGMRVCCVSKICKLQGACFGTCHAVHTAKIL